MHASWWLLWILTCMGTDARVRCGAGVRPRNVPGGSRTSCTRVRERAYFLARAGLLNAVVDTCWLLVCCADLSFPFTNVGL
jgi:hypothetical protein